MYAGEKNIGTNKFVLVSYEFLLFYSLPILIPLYIKIAALGHKSYNGISSLFKLNGKGYTAR